FLTDVEKVFLHQRWKLAHFAAELKRSVKIRACRGVLDRSLESIPERRFFQGLGPERADRAARFTQTSARQFTSTLQMTGRIFLVALRGCILSRLQLDNHTGETLSQRIVDVSRHPIAFIEDRREPALLG